MTFKRPERRAFQIVGNELRIDLRRVFELLYLQALSIFEKAKSAI
jgi:hypothetical protein